MDKAVLQYAFIKASCWFKKVDFFFREIVQQYWFPISSVEGLFIDPHETACFIWFAFVLNTAKAVSPLAMIPFVVVVEFDLPDCLKNSNVIKL